MDRPDHHQHQFFMPAPVQVPQPPHQQLCVPTMMDEPPASPFLAVGMGGGGVGGGPSSAAAAAARGSERKRRFTEEQIRSLESMFHAHHAKLEPGEKAELARELGLQPRQVAIWFQNKRARWRSKQLEHDYALLRAKFDDLHARVEALKQDKLALTTQLNELSEKLREREDRQGCGGATTASSSCCNGGVGEAEEPEDDKKNVVLGCGVVSNMEPPPESCVLVGSCATPADVSVEESECDDHHHHHLDYDDGFLESYCAMPGLWEPWSLVEWNAVS